MTDRQAQILSIIVKNYVKNSKPVGSTSILDTLNLSLSSATVRNEMVNLEKEGFIQSPHTSAGRIPTDKGYRWYINSLTEPKQNLKDREKDALKRKIESFSGSDMAIKRAVDLLSDITGSTALVTTSSNDVYYHGLRYILRSPEFENRDQMLGIADLVDNLIDFFHELPAFESEIIYIGEENPYLRKAHCAFLASPYNFRDRAGVMGILGPTRMDYERNLELLDFITKELNQY